MISRLASAAVLVIAGLGLIWLGGELLWLRGSPYYLFAGVMTTTSGMLIARGNWRGVSLYAAFLVVTVVWAIWEAGFDGWALAPRLAGPLALGLWMLTPWFRHAMGATRPLPGGKILWPALAIAVLAGVGWIAWLDHPTGGHGPMAADAAPADRAAGDWANFGDDPGGTRASPLAQITPANAGALKVAWTYHTGPAPNGETAQFEGTPLKVGDKVYICTGYDDVIALDADSGAQAWRFRAHVDPAGIGHFACRGVAYYRVPGATGPCAGRIYIAAVDARLIALDAQDGKPCQGFGQGGQVDLLQGLGPVVRGYYSTTSPVQVVRGRLVIGGWVTDGQTVGEPSGVIRAYDAVTGAFDWAFDSGRPDDHGMPPAGQRFTPGTPNSWAPMSADASLGLVYVPTGNATPDYFGGQRRTADDRISSAVVALDVETGAVRWLFQTAHHDLWDYDVGSQPTLVDLPDGAKGLIQPTKRGEIFLLDRRTGAPLAKVEERAAPKGPAAGEYLSPTQPFSTGMPAFGGPPLTEAMMWGLTPIDQAMCRIAFRRARYEGQMTPLSVERPTIVYPGFLGGSDWGGVSIDPRRGVMIVNSSRLANYDQLITRAEADRMGLHPIGPGHMGYVGGAAAQAGTPYAAKITPFVSPLGVPCQQPPYGMLSAVDLKSRTVLWTRRFGTARDSGPFGWRSRLPIPMGVPNIGGSATTAGGVTFIGATQEHALHAYDTATGAELWRDRLPAGAQAAPAVYWSDRSGREFVVVAAGGHSVLAPGLSDTLIAYALPKGS